MHTHACKHANTYTTCVNAQKSLLNVYTSLLECSNDQPMVVCVLLDREEPEYHCQFTQLDYICRAKLVLVSLFKNGTPL